MVSVAGVQMDFDKITTIINSPEPANIKQSRSLLGISGYYSRLIHYYTNNAQPLTDLLKKNSFYWTLTTKSAFLKLKEAIVSALLLQLPNFSIPFILETDALGVAIGAI